MSLCEHVWCLCIVIFGERGMEPDIERKRKKERERIFLSIHHIAPPKILYWCGRLVDRSVDSMLSLSLSYHPHNIYMRIIIFIYSIHIRPWTTFAEFILHDCVPAAHTCVYACIIWIASFFLCAVSRALASAIDDFLWNFVQYSIYKWNQMCKNQDLSLAIFACILSCLLWYRENLF